MGHAQDSSGASPSKSGAALEHEPELIRSLFRGVEVYPNLTAIDFREMGKFTEQTNVRGLPVHSIRRPVRGQKIREFPGRLQELPTHKTGDPVASFRSLFSEGPSLLLRGRIAEGCGRPVRLTVIIPQSHAHLAQGVDALLWPVTPEEVGNFQSDLHLILWPESAEQLVLHLAASRLVIALGSDDMRAGLFVAIEAANRLWNARTQDRMVMEERNKDSASGPGERWEEIRILPGGSLALPNDADDGLLIFLSESVPDQWERKVVEKVGCLRGRDAREILLAGAEPWVAEGGGLVSPLWRNPPLPASLLAAAPGWTAAALDPDALPYGACVGERGEIELTGSRENAFIIVPRQRIPPPFAGSAAPVRVRRLITYRYAKQDAMELWARGFPAPEIV